MSGGVSRRPAAVPRLQVRTVPIEDPGDLLARLPDPGGLVWVRAGAGLVAWGTATALPVGTGPDRFADAARRLAALAGNAEVDDRVRRRGTGLVAFGSFTFDEDASGSVLVVPRTLVGRDRGGAWLTIVGDRDEPAVLGPVQAVPAPTRVRYAGSTVAELAWLEAVDRVAREVRDGLLEKVVLARDLLVWASEPLDTRLLVQRLAERFPACYTFACDGLVGATPELLVRRSGTAVSSLVLAGSARRGATAEEDEAVGAGLLASDKERAEHAPAVASVREVLAPRCAELHVDPEPWLLRLDNVQHLATEVRGRLVAPLTAFELAGALHPTAAVCGSPRRLALQRIRELEGMNRGRYAGPVGWVDAAGDGEFGIALRCAEVSDAHARLFAGAGVVGASLPEAELEETRLKLLAMRAALEG